ncbi:MAG: hypothetical protein AAGF71_12035 [Pseudomonadota bacterium]
MDAAPHRLDTPVESALGEAASRMALGFSRPAIVGVRMALIVGAVEFLALALGLWFVQYATAVNFNPFVGVAVAIALAVSGVITNVMCRRYALPRLTKTKAGVVSSDVNRSPLRGRSRIGCICRGCGG